MPSTRVLIVDDQPVFRQVACDLLEARGYAVVAEAEGLATALEALGHSRPDAVLLDVCLDEENGFDVARALTRACVLGSPCCWSPPTTRMWDASASGAAEHAGSSPSRAWSTRTSRRSGGKSEALRGPSLI